MNYQTFINDVVAFLSSSISKEKKVVLQPVVKNNGTVYDGLIIIDPILNISPTIYLNPYYSRFLSGSSMEDICEDILETYSNNLPTKDFDISSFRNFAQAKKHIACKLVNKEKNKELLSDVPHVEFQDLVLLFVYIASEFMEEYATILIHNQHMSLWKVTTNELYQIAMQNTPKLLPYHFENMECVLENTEEDSSPACPMYILTNHLKIHGAVCMVYPNVLKQIAENFNDNLIILPSSIHEVLIVPQSDTSPTALEEYSALIQDINDTELTDDEILSNHAYFYEKEAGQISY